MDDDVHKTNKRSKFYKTPNTIMMTKQRSLTPDKHSDDPISAVTHVRRSLTPERYDIIGAAMGGIAGKKNSIGGGGGGGSDAGSQGSLFVRHSSGGSAGSRSSTLERQQLDEKTVPISSRSSSSSSYSGGADQHEPMGFRRVPQRHAPRSAEHRIRRSRCVLS